MVPYWRINSYGHIRIARFDHVVEEFTHTVKTLELKRSSGWRQVH